MPTSRIALLSLAAVASAEFDFLGHGACATITQPYVAKNGTYIEESHKKQFEHWYKFGGSCSGFPGHEPHGDAEMEAWCKMTPACLGFDYSCCDNTKEKCIAGGRLLFGLNTLPDANAPPGFSLHGYDGFPTSGPDYQAEAPGGVNGGINVLIDVGVSHRTSGFLGYRCYKKVPTPPTTSQTTTPVPPCSKLDSSYCNDKDWSADCRWAGSAGCVPRKGTSDCSKLDSSYCKDKDWSMDCRWAGSAGCFPRGGKINSTAEVLI